MGCPVVGPPLREVVPGECEVGVDEYQPVVGGSASLPRVARRRPERKSVSRSASSPSSSWLWPLGSAAVGPARPRPIFVEIFSGAGRLSKAFETRGWDVVAWDVTSGPQQELTVKSARDRLLTLVRRANFVHLATPCSTFSTARRGLPGRPDGPLRSRLCPYGLPDLPDPLKKKVVAANLLVRLTAKVIRIALESAIPVPLENPRRSALWRLPCLAAVLAKSSFVHCDSCQFGAPWRKSSRLATWGGA